VVAELSTVVKRRDGVLSPDADTDEAVEPWWRPAPHAAIESAGMASPMLFTTLRQHGRVVGPVSASSVVLG
jgi:hypothetical protein